MRCQAVVLSLLLAFSGAVAGAVERCEKLVATGNPDQPPYLWRDPASPRHLIGASADLLHLLGERLNVKIELLDLGDRQQAEDEVRQGRADVLVGADLSGAGLGQMDYVHPAFYQTSAVVISRSEPALPYATWSDLFGRRGAAVAGTRFGQAFDDFATQRLRLQQTDNLGQALQLLLHGRTDYVLYERYPAELLIRQLGVAAQLHMQAEPVVTQGMYLALSHNSACNEAALRGQLAQKMPELLASGVAEALLQRNIERWLGQQPLPPALPLKQEDSP